MIPASPKMKFIDFEQNIYSQIIGQYRHEQSRINVNIVVENNKLMLYLKQPDSEDKIELLPLTEKKFYGKSKEKGDLYFTFFKDSKDKVTHFTVHGEFGFTRVQFEKAN
jgi:hypothetical protein